MDAQRKTMVITGAGSGIGLATALLFARRNYRVFACDLQFDTDVVGEFSALGIRHEICDVTNTKALTAFIRTAAKQSGRLDTLVNNAGIGLVAQIQDVSEKQWELVLDTNLKAAFFGCQAAIAEMATQETGGSIVNIASNAGLLPRSHDPVYSISKMALVGLTRSMALCHSADRIRVNAVCPGPVERTQIIEENFCAGEDREPVVRRMIQASPLARSWGRMIKPEEVAETVFFLAGDAARMITGTSVAIDGGKSLGVPPPENDSESELIDNEVS